MPPLVNKLTIDVICYTKANKVFGSLGKNDFEAQVEFTLKVMERARVSCCCCDSYERQFASVCTQNFRNLGGSVW